MKTKLIIFEGIPGSGKSTLAHKSTLILNKHAKEKNFSKPTLHREGCYHPANLEGCFIIPNDKTNELLTQFPKFEQEIRNTMIETDEYSLIPRSKDFKSGSKISKYLQEHAISGINSELFAKLNQKRWSAFTAALVKQGNTAIFDCAFLQDQITDLMLWYEKSESDIIEYMKRLEETILELNPFLFYLQQKNVDETIKRITEQRINEPDGRPWGERVAEMISTSPYGKAHDLHGYDGMVEFFRCRKAIDLSVLNSLKIKHILIDNDNYDWKAMQGEVFEILGNLATV